MSLVIFLLLITVGWGTLKAAELVTHALVLKDSIFSGAQFGITHLTQAEQALVSQDLSGAHDQFTLAVQSFGDSKREINEGGAIINDIVSLLPQKHDAQNILDAATLISQSGEAMTQFYGSVKNLSFSAQGLESTEGVKQTLDSLSASLSSAAASINEAQTKLITVDGSILPSSKRSEFIDLKGKLNVAQTAINNFQDIFSLFYNIVIPKQNVVVMFENNNELRPGGGFMGTYGKFHTENGQIQNLTISSIYDLDGQLLENITPPTPLLAVNDRWYLRDSNWFANFPDSAKKISSFYEKEGGETPDVIVAVTPNIVVDLLKVTGPVQVPTYNVELNSDNFVEQTQAISTMSYNVPLNKPKQILSDFFSVFLQKLASLPKEKYAAVLTVVEHELQNKQIVMYSRDPKLENVLKSYNWDGSLHDSDRDYLEVVSANLSGTKTDLDLQKKLDLNSSIAADGTVTDTVTMTETNPLPKIAGTENESFIRFLVPQGSKLISSSGFELKVLDPEFQKGYKQDPDVQAMEQSELKNLVTGTIIGTESGKTFFGNWIAVDGGESKTVQLVYELPYRLQSPDRFSLVAQKQIGSTDIPFSYKLNFSGKELKWKNFDTDSLEADQLTASRLLDQDLFFGMVLENR